MSKELPKDHPVSAHKDIIGQTMHRWKHRDPKPLHSGRGKGGKEGKIVKSQDQAIAIALSIAEKAKSKGKKKIADHIEGMSSLGYSEKQIAFVQAKLESYDFARCVRPNGTAYGTAGTCRKGYQREKDEKYPYKAAVTQGRFNIPHKGHAKLIKSMLEKAPIAYVVVGSGEKNINRDFRTQMLRAVLKKDGVDLSRVRILRGTRVASVAKGLADEVGKDNVVMMLGEDQGKFLQSMGKSLGVQTGIIPRSDEGASSSAIRKMIDSKNQDALSKEFDGDPYLMRLAQVARQIEKNEFAEYLEVIRG